jgi:hypothetical protein
MLNRGDIIETPENIDALPAGAADCNLSGDCLVENGIGMQRKLPWSPWPSAARPDVDICLEFKRYPKCSASAGR